jgi:hypothetical protein
MGASGSKDIPAVFGENRADGNSIHGSSTTAIWVIGNSTSGSGVWGRSRSSAGVGGMSDNGAGVHGVSNAGPGVRGDAGDGDNCQTGAPFPSLAGLFTFHQGGTLAEYGIGRFESRTPEPGHGVWQRLAGWQLYSFAFTFNRYNASGIFLGTQRVAGELKLGASGDTFATRSVVEILDGERRRRRKRPRHRCRDTVRMRRAALRHYSSGMMTWVAEFMASPGSYGAVGAWHITGLGHHLCLRGDRPGLCVGVCVSGGLGPCRRGVGLRTAVMLPPDRANASYRHSRRRHECCS